MQQAHLFVAVLGAISYTYAEATPDERLTSWIGAHVRTFEFYQGVPKLVVPDNTKTVLVERWIIAALRHRRFFSIEDLDQAIRELHDRIN